MRVVLLTLSVGSLLLLVAGCFHARYVAQAAFGQLDLVADARPIDEVIADPDTDERTRELLREVGGITAFARDRGLVLGDSYRDYVDLRREAVVWFITASRSLAFEPKLWWFPVVGSFPYLGWFDSRDAVRQRDQLERDGWDVYVRPVRAYSTGGWFTDPLLSTMLPDGEDAVAYLANILIHELVHANVLVADQSTFNESVASFVGDALAGDYVAGRYGADSPELARYREELAEDRRVGERLLAAYRELDAIYTGDRPDADKLAEKRRVLAALADEVTVYGELNNAMLLGYRTYNEGQPELARLLDDCGRDWSRFLATLRDVPASAFGEEQLEAIGPVIAKLRCRDGAVSSARPPPAGRARPRHPRLRAARPAPARFVRGSSRPAPPRAP